MDQARESAQASRRREATRATLWGLLVAGLVVAGIYFGSRGLKDFDTALVSYAGASVFAAFGVGYRYAMWLRRPPTRLYWRRGWQLFLSPRRLPGNLLRLVPLLWHNIIAQTFIRRRSHLRWSAHMFLFWGVVLAAAITFPLSFGWIHFETPPDSQQRYLAFVFGLQITSYRLGTITAEIIFNGLVFASVLVLIGVFLALWRRARDLDALAVEQLASDFLPLIFLFAISVTGLLLTVSARFMHGFHYVFLSQIHAVTVILALLYLPFGKFFHIFQRPAQLSLDYYRRAGEETGPAQCVRCGGPFASKLHVSDLKDVEGDLGIRYQLESGVHYQEVCPSCRRKTLALLQDDLWQDARRRTATQRNS
ncbi:MAG TPA: MFS transporter [Planctomycetota bacterium]|nr:MFS transporter [Planctomycetota bacterium]